ncbi:glycosyltransferase [Enterococcus casseliflavus]|uniref:glycosyltransferase n=1 Tax=Enterococcus casseliflavus TaxID=37734 RepID=UPI0011586F4A|nr:glycosyltransferase [Enterococcus casseliflavus]
MKKLLLVLEHHFVIDSEEKLWSDRVVDQTFLKRYTEVFDEVFILARAEYKEPEEKYNAIENENIHIIPLPNFKGAKGLVNNMSVVISIFKKKITTVDAVLLRAPSPLAILLYRFIPKNLPCACEFVMGANNFFNNNAVGSLLNKIIDREAKKMTLKMNGVSYVTEKKLQYKYPCKAIKEGESDFYFTTHYSSIDLADDYFYCRKKMNKNEYITLVEVGFMDSMRKGQNILIETAQILLEKGYPIKVKLVGDGNKKEYFQKLCSELNIRENVDFVGEISEKLRIRKILIDSDIFVLPSYSEGLPRVLIEAMAVGLPAVASNVDGIPELIDNKYIIKSFEAKDYAEKIELLIKNDKEYLIQSDLNYKKSLTYRCEILEKRRIDFYQKLYNLSYVR